MGLKGHPQNIAQPHGCPTFINRGISPRFTAHPLIPTITSSTTSRPDNRKGKTRTFEGEQPGDPHRRCDAAACGYTPPPPQRHLSFGIRSPGCHHAAQLSESLQRSKRGRNGEIHRSIRWSTIVSATARAGVPHVFNDSDTETSITTDPSLGGVAFDGSGHRRKINEKISTGSDDQCDTMIGPTLPNRRRNGFGFQRPAFRIFIMDGIARLQKRSILQSISGQRVIAGWGSGIGFEKNGMTSVIPCGTCPQTRFRASAHRQPALSAGPFPSGRVREAEDGRWAGAAAGRISECDAKAFARACLIRSRTTFVSNGLERADHSDIFFKNSKAGRGTRLPGQIAWRPGSSSPH